MIVDVAIDQGGCVETINATTHENPTYVVDGVIHYGVANMPGGVPRTSTLALTNATLPYALQLANKGWKRALQGQPGAAQGPEHGRGQGHVRRRRRGVRDGVPRAGEVPRLAFEMAVTKLSNARHTVAPVVLTCCSTRDTRDLRIARDDADVRRS